MFGFKRRPPYSQEEISEQIGQIGDLMKQRDKAQPETDEPKRFTDAIAVSQEVLAFMLDEVRDHGRH